MIPVQGPSPTTPRAATSAPQSLMGARPAKSLVESPAALSASRATKFLCRSAATLLPTQFLMATEDAVYALLTVNLVSIMLELWNVRLATHKMGFTFLGRLAAIPTTTPSQTLKMGVIAALR